MSRRARKAQAAFPTLIGKALFYPLRLPSTVRCPTLTAAIGHARTGVPDVRQRTEHR